MRTPRQRNNKLLTLAAVCFLAWGGAFTLFAQEPYVHWVTTVPTGVLDNAGDPEPVCATGDGGLVDYASSHRITPQGKLVLGNTNIFPGILPWKVKTDALGNQYCMGGTVGGTFVGKYGPTNNLLWSRIGEGPIYLYDMDVDDGGNLALGGIASGPCKLGSFESDGDTGLFFCKFDTNGNLLWGRKVVSQFTRPPSQIYMLKKIALDGSGNVIACGILDLGSSDFGGTIVDHMAANGFFDGYIAKYNPSGELLWVTLKDYATDIAVDHHGNVYVVDVHGLLKLNANGDLLWEKSLAECSGVVLDEQGQPVFTGTFSGTAQFDAITLRSRGDADFFVAKADPSGSILWAIAGGGPNWDTGETVACDTAGNIFLMAKISKGSPGLFDGISIVPIPTEPYETWLVARISERPPLQMAPSPSSVQLSWPAKATNYVLEAASSLAPGSIWTPVTDTPTVGGRQRILSVDTTLSTQFFRLRKQ